MFRSTMYVATFWGCRRRRIAWAPSPSSGSLPLSKRRSASASVRRPPPLALSMTSRTVVGIFSEEFQACPFGRPEVKGDRFRQVRPAIGRGQLQPGGLASGDFRDLLRPPLLRRPQGRRDLASLRMAGPVGPERIDERSARERLPFAPQVEERDADGTKRSISDGHRGVNRFEGQALRGVPREVARTKTISLFQQGSRPAVRRPGIPIRRQAADLAEREPVMEAD